MLAGDPRMYAFVLVILLRILAPGGSRRGRNR